MGHPTPNWPSRWRLWLPLHCRALYTGGSQSAFRWGRIYIIRNVPPSDGLFGTNWEFKAGRRIRVEAQSTNVIGVIGIRIYDDVYKLSENGKIMPRFQNRNSPVKQTALYVPPVFTREREITADFDSPFGYYWYVRTESARTTDIESHIFYTVYR